MSVNSYWGDLFEDIDFDDLLNHYNKVLARGNNGSMTAGDLRTFIDYHDSKMELFW